MNVIEWAQRRLNLCGEKRWHIARVFRVWNHRRFCWSCWCREMNGLPSSTRAWRIEHTGDVGRSPAFASAAHSDAATPSHACDDSGTVTRWHRPI